MTRKEAIELLRELSNFVATPPETDEALNMAIEALEHDKKEIINMKSVFNLSDDLISRQAAIYALRAMQTYKLGAGEDMLLIDQAEAQTELMLLPSAQPFTEEQIQTMQELESAQIEKAYELGKADRPTGHWIDTEFLKLKECSCCHCRWGMYDVENFDFCPNCGARMESEEE